MSPDTLITLALLILFLPLLSFGILLAAGKRLPRQGDVIGTGIMFLSLALSIVVLIGTLTRPEAPAIPGFPIPPIQSFFTWIDLHSSIWVFGQEVPLRIDLGIMLDNIAAIMLVVVTLISSLVHLYSISYMHGDKKYSRYFAFLGLFSFSMLGIVLTNNILMMYVFWELVGVSSYLLIGFWYEKPGPAYASKKAFLMNRVGDAGMFIGILTLFTTYGSFQFDKVFAAISLGQFPMNSDFWLTVMGLCLFCGAIGKSAQFPLHTWLPDAMEGPTPVSALIHAATMVAAGVYLVARIFPLLTGDALITIAVIGLVTSFIAATIAIAQNDIKKVLAYSTVSQLGYMVMALGLGAYTAGVFHLVTHAMFKACLFLGSGSVIHAMHHSLHHLHDHDTDAQDIRNMGGLKSKMPVTFLTFLVATLAISGVPLFSGFLSKDEILAGAWALGGMKHGIAQVIPWVGFGIAALTAFYMFRLVFLTFYGEPRRKDIHEHVKESPLPIKIPLIVLSVLSLWFVFSFNPFGGASGWFMKSVTAPMTVTGQYWYAIGHEGSHEASTSMDHEGTESPAHSVEAVKTHPGQEALLHATHESHMPAMITSLIVAFLGIGISFLTYYKRKISADVVAAKLAPVHVFFQRKWFFDEIYEEWVVIPLVMLIARLSHWFDAHIVDGAVNGLAWLTRWKSMASGLFDKYIVDGLVNLSGYVVGFFGLLMKKSQTGRIQTYVTFAVLGVIVLFFYMIF